jgi:curved DNA-binding protein CbpA
MRRWQATAMYDPNTDLYTVLGLNETTDGDAIRQAHRVHIMAIHPDLNVSADATRRSAALNAARDVLLDPARRQQYDTARLLWRLQQALNPPPSVPPVVVQSAVQVPVAPAASTSPPVAETPVPTGFGQVEGMAQRFEWYVKVPVASPAQAFFRGMFMGFDFLLAAHRAGREP